MNASTTPSVQPISIETTASHTVVQAPSRMYGLNR